MHATSERSQSIAPVALTPKGELYLLLTRLLADLDTLSSREQEELLVSIRVARRAAAHR